MLILKHLHTTSPNLGEENSQYTRNSMVLNNIPVPNRDRNHNCKHALSDSCKCYILSPRKKQFLKASAIATCTAQTAGSAPAFNTSCTGEHLQRTAGALSLQEDFFTRGKKPQVCILKQVGKLKVLEASPNCSAYPAMWKALAVPQLQAALSSCALAEADSSSNNCLSFLLVFLSAFSLVRNFLLPNMTTICTIPSDTSDVNVTEPQSYFRVSSISRDCWTT